MKEQTNRQTDSPKCIISLASWIFVDIQIYLARSVVGVQYTFSVPVVDDCKNLFSIWTAALYFYVLALVLPVKWRLVCWHLERNNKRWVTSDVSTPFILIVWRSPGHHIKIQCCRPGREEVQIYTWTPCHPQCALQLHYAWYGMVKCTYSVLLCRHGPKPASAQASRSWLLGVKALAS